MPSKSHRQESVTSENTPLLATASEEPVIPFNDSEILQDAPKGSDDEEDEDEEGHVVEIPLPRKQIFLLCFARMIDPVAFFGIFPFVNKMIQEVGHVAKADVGFYSGTIVSTPSLNMRVLNLNVLGIVILFHSDDIYDILGQSCRPNRP